MAAHRRRPSPSRFYWIIILVFAVVVLGGFYFLSSLGPRSSGSAEEWENTDPEVTGFLEQSYQLEEEFDQLVLQGVVDREDVEILARAVELQKQYISRRPGLDFEAENRLEELNRKLSEYMGEIRAREAEQLEAEAEALMETDRGAALARYMQALEIREEIRDRYWSSSYNSSAALSRLKRTVQNLSMTPRYERSLELEREAVALEERGELALAVEKYAEAAELQEEINRGYPGLAVSKPLRATRLREKEAEVLSGQLKRRIDDLLREGNDLVYNGVYDEAAAVFARARELQRSLNLEYANSPFASKAREDLLQVRQQNAAGFSSYLELTAIERLLNEALFERNFVEARALLGRLSEQINQFGIRFSKSTLPVETLVERVSYLRRKERLFEEIFSTINADLLALPGSPDVRMLATEVPQFLYELLMDGNPSRNKGPNLPVETVSGAEVSLFLQRAGWILAREVRLPTVEEFEEVAREAADQAGLTVFSLESGEEDAVGVKFGESDQNGYYHLLGNVSEIAQDILGSDNLMQVGGSLRTFEEEMRLLNAFPIGENERNRMIGFRFVVVDEILPVSLPREPDL